MVSVLTRAVFRGSFPYGDVERCGVCGASPGQIVYMYTIGLSMPDKREAFGRCWFNVGPRRIDGRPALIRHWFGVSCFAG